MLIRHFDEFLSHRYRLSRTSQVGEQVNDGELIPIDALGRRVAIRSGIPRFVDSQNYASNFGFQWKAFSETQLDSATGLPLSFNRFWNNTGWKPRDLHGALVLEVGSGAGRFTEVLLEAGARVVSVDFSEAIEVNLRSNGSKGDVFGLQGDVYELPFRPASFDFVFCYGVIQHTPDPKRTLSSILDMVRPGGKASVDFYRKMPLPTPLTTPKYLWRPLTRQMDPERLFRAVEWYVPRWLPVDTLIKGTIGRIPRIGPVLTGLIPVPCWNYARMGLSKKQRREWAILDTFDALGARYDFPMTPEEVEQMAQAFPSFQSTVSLGSNGIVANFVR